MGITKSLATFLAIAAKTWGIEEPVLVLGKQHVYITFDELAMLCRENGINNDLKTFSADMMTDMPNWTHGVDNGFITDKTLLRGFGCFDVDFLDVSDYENANIIHDLNLPVPKHLHGHYKTIIDAGTSEHIFDVKTCLNNLFDLAKPGATIVHFTQGNNYLNHGFYQFSPTFFYDFYASRESERMQCYLTYQGFSDCTRNLWSWYTHDRLNTGAIALDAASYGLTFIATKSLELAKVNGSPQQGFAGAPVRYPPPSGRVFRARNAIPEPIRASLRRLKLRDQLWKRM